MSLAGDINQLKGYFIGIGQEDMAALAKAAEICALELVDETLRLANQRNDAEAQIARIRKAWYAFLDEHANGRDEVDGINAVSEAVDPGTVDA